MEKTHYYRAADVINIQNFAMFLWDRTEVLTPNTPIKILTPLGVVGQVDSFFNLCMRRAKELIDVARSSDKKICLLWSGGLDSTCVFLCLRELADTKDIIVAYTKDSLLEYPGFFESHIQPNFETIEFSMASIWRLMESACRKYIVVTGEIGDQLFGSDVYLTLTKDQLQDEWSNYWSYFDKHKRPGQLIETFVSGSPKPISTVADLLWWCNYATKYQIVQIRTLLDNTSSILNSTIFHFFDTNYFNDYAVSTSSEEKIPDFDVANYKMPLRNVIFRLSKDRIYAYTKPKQRSLMPSYGRLSAMKLANSIDTFWNRGYP